MKRWLVLAAATLLLVSDLWVLISANRNRATPSGGAVELTERELGLPPMIGDSTAILLELKWDRKSPDWLDLAKLGDLGFDCHVPLANPKARVHYSSLPPRLVFLALEYEGEAWKAANRDHTAADGPDAKTRLSRKPRLFIVDAGREANRLREKYPDRSRWIITRGTVRPFFQAPGMHEAENLTEPRLRAWINIVPHQIFVPQPYSKVLQGLRRDGDQPEQETGTAPRYAVTVSWGAGYEPWVQAVRHLAPTDSTPKTP